MPISRKQFDQWVEEAIEMVPKRLIKGMRDLVFVVDDRPTRKIIKESELRRGYGLFGFYHGFEKTDSKDFSNSPDRIYVYRKPILEQYETKRTMKSQVYKTIWHEVSHHFGSDEEGAARAEKRMFERYVEKNRQEKKYKREIKKNSKVKKGRRDNKRKTKTTFRIDKGSIT